MGSGSKVIAALGVVLAAAGCTTENGTQGPQGPQQPMLTAGSPAMQNPAQNTAGSVAMNAPSMTGAGGTNAPGVVMTAGTTAMMPNVPQAGAAPVAGAGGTGMEPMMVGPKTIPSARNGCPDLHTSFPGDDACLAPPDPAKGFQIHIGPSSYTDMAELSKFTFEPGEESSECYMKPLPIDQDRLYMVYELSGRPGTHHIINTLLNNSTAQGWSACEAQIVGGSNNGGNVGGASKAHMPPIPIAPENEKLGIPLKAHQTVQHDMHYFNFTQATILREFWMNVYYVDPETATERPNRIVGMGGFGYNIAPGTHQTYKYECAATGGDGRLIQLLGHTHAHGIRETAHIRRASGERLKVFEQFDYLEPQLFMYDSLTQNPMFSANAAGAYTGILPLKAGDVLEWECEINNDSTETLRYTNEVKTGEMCNIWGFTVGPTISCTLF